MNICSNNLKTNNNCFNKKSLIKIIKKYNEEYLNDKIENYNNKNYTELYDLLNMKIINNTKCKDQTCWVKLDFINKLNDKYINNAFKPKRPNNWDNNNTEWLSTIDIENVMKQYELNSDFKFIGPAPIDFDEKPYNIDMCIVDELCNINLENLYLKGIRKIGVIFNFDKHNETGSHWVALFINLNKGGIYYFDSYGKEPKNQIKILMDRLRKQGNNLINKNLLNLEDDYIVKSDYIKKKNKLIIKDNIALEYDTFTYLAKKKIKSKLFKIIDIDKNKIIQIPKDIDLNKYSKIIQIGFHKFFNNVRFQYKNSECGVYSMYFIISLLNGQKFKDFIKNIIDDDTINKLRYKYYR